MEKELNSVFLNKRKEKSYLNQIYKTNKLGDTLKKVELKEEDDEFCLTPKYIPWGSIEINERGGIFVYIPPLHRRLAYFDPEGRFIKDFGYPYTGEKGKKETICGITLDYRKRDLYVLYTPLEGVTPYKPFPLRMKKYSYPAYRIVKNFNLREKAIYASIYDALSIDSKGNLYVVNKDSLICKFSPEGRLLKKISLKTPLHHPYDYLPYSAFTYPIFTGVPIQWLRIDY